LPRSITGFPRSTPGSSTDSSSQHQTQRSGAFALIIPKPTQMRHSLIVALPSSQPQTAHKRALSTLKVLGAKSPWYAHRCPRDARRGRTSCHRTRISTTDDALALRNRSLPTFDLDTCNYIYTYTCTYSDARGLQTGRSASIADAASSAEKQCKLPTPTPTSVPIQGTPSPMLA